jgi:hypothetical protein
MLAGGIHRSALIPVAAWLAGMQLAAAQIINPVYPPTPTVPPIIDQVTPTPTSPPLPNPGVLPKADPQQARALVYYGQSGTLTLANDRGRFQKVALQPGEVVSVVRTLSPADYGKPAEVQVLYEGAMTTSMPEPTVPKDIAPTPTPYPSPTINAVPISSGPGSTATPPPMVTPPPIPDPATLIDSGQLATVSTSGELVFAFKPGADIGLHRVSVLVGGNQYFLQFWRQDPSAPNNNPRMLHAY